MGTLIVYNQDGIEIPLPTAKIVCPRCNGEGKHVNPNIDIGGIDLEVLCEDPNFAEAYFGGRYDIQCEECNGRNVVDAVICEDLTVEQQKAYDEYLEYEAEKVHHRWCLDRGIHY